MHGDFAGALGLFACRGALGRSARVVAVGPGGSSGASSDARLEAGLSGALAGSGGGAVDEGGAAWAATGALGSLRLVELGPRLLELSLIAAPLLVMSALLAGMVRWVLGVVRAGGGPSLG